MPNLATRTGRRHNERGLRRIAATTTVVLALCSGLAEAGPAVTVDSIPSAATGSAPAQSVFAAPDMVVVNNRANALATDVFNATTAAADSIGAVWAPGRSASVAMDDVTRAGAVIQQAPPGYHFTMGVTVLPLAAVGPLMGKNVAGVLAQGDIVMGTLTASLRGAQVGDVADIETRTGVVVPLTIGMIADDALIGGTEILMAPTTADSLGISVVSRLVVWGFTSRAALDQALTTTGVEPRDDVRVRRSWDAFDPDLTLGMAETKQALGEFTYRLLSDGINLSLSPDWAATNLPPDFQEFVPAISVRARCNNAIHNDLVAALVDVAQAGLGSAIDIANTNTYGGCFGPRLNRISGALGFISRHTWAQAIDMNTTENAQGHVPRMNCDVVRIFRRHNFAWGGNFLTPDGMHFEWVGTRRDLYQYPSKYCPNLPPGGTPQSVNAPRTSGPVGVNANGGEANRATLFAGDGFSSGD